MRKPRKFLRKLSAEQLARLSSVERRTFLKTVGGATAGAVVGLKSKTVYADPNIDGTTVSQAPPGQINSVVEFEVTKANNFTALNQAQFLAQWATMTGGTPPDIKGIKWSVPIAKPTKTKLKLLSGPAGAQMGTLFNGGNFKMPVGKYKIRVLVPK